MGTEGFFPGSKAAGA